MQQEFPLVIKLTLAQMAIDNIPTQVMRFFIKCHGLLSDGAEYKDLCEAANLTLNGCKSHLIVLERHGYVVATLMPRPNNQHGGRDFHIWSLTGTLLKDPELQTVERVMRLQHGLASRSPGKSLLSAQT